MAWTAPAKAVVIEDGTPVLPGGSTMNAMRVGLDLAKSVFQVHGVDSYGQAVVRRRLARSQLLGFFAKLPPCVIGIEACSSAHHWARELTRLGHEVRLLPPQYVKPYVKRNKSDAADAEAICEAVGRPNMRFVPIKTEEQQAILALHRVRSLLVRQRTASINAIRGLLGEFGLVAAKGAARLDELRRRLAVATGEQIPPAARLAIEELFTHVDDLRVRAATIEAEIVAGHQANETSRRLAAVPGVGALTASALVAAVGDARQFRSARHFAAWLGLTPRMTSSGDKQRIGHISKGGDRYLRTLLIHGARAVVGAVNRPNLRPRPWLIPLLARRPIPVAATALAHKTARIIWAMLTRGETYRVRAITTA
jgi:transposase